MPCVEKIVMSLPPSSLRESTSLREGGKNCKATNSRQLGSLLEGAVEIACRF